MSVSQNLCGCDFLPGHPLHLLVKALLLRHGGREALALQIDERSLLLAVGLDLDLGLEAIVFLVVSRARGLECRTLAVNLRCPLSAPCYAAALALFDGRWGELSAADRPLVVLDGFTSLRNRSFHLGCKLHFWR